MGHSENGAGVKSPPVPSTPKIDVIANTQLMGKSRWKLYTIKSCEVHITTHNKDTEVLQIWMFDFQFE